MVSVFVKLSRTYPGRVPLWNRWLSESDNMSMIKFIGSWRPMLAFHLH